MYSVYQAILRLYPTEYRAAFAPEILQTLEQAASDRRAQGHILFLSFAVCELTGVLTGLFSEWMAKWTAREGYVTTRCSPREFQISRPRLLRFKIVCSVRSPQWSPPLHTMIFPRRASTRMRSVSRERCCNG
jgi:hypothetical protein